MRRVKCSITFFYDSETYLHEEWDGGENPEHPTDLEIFERCRRMMLEDVADTQNPIDSIAIEAEFIEDNDPKFPNLLKWREEDAG